MPGETLNPYALVVSVAIAVLALGIVRNADAYRQGKANEIAPGIVHMNDSVVYPVVADPTTQQMRSQEEIARYSFFA